MGNLKKILYYIFPKTRDVIKREVIDGCYLYSKESDLYDLGYSGEKFVSHYDDGTKKIIWREARCGGVINEIFEADIDKDGLVAGKKILHQSAYSQIVFTCSIATSFKYLEINFRRGCLKEVWIDNRFKKNNYEPMEQSRLNSVWSKEEIKLPV